MHHIAVQLRILLDTNINHNTHCDDNKHLTVLFMGFVGIITMKKPLYYVILASLVLFGHGTSQCTMHHGYAFISLLKVVTKPIIYLIMK